MKNRTKEKSISNLAALLLFCVFSAGILSVLLGGAGVYRRLTKRDQASYDSRTCAQYLATKVRQASAPDAVVLSEFGEGDALCILEEIDGEDYVTRVYCWDGWLMELFSIAGEGFAPEDGERILKISGIEIECKGEMLSVKTWGETGDVMEQKLFLRGEGGAFYEG